MINPMTAATMLVKHGLTDNLKEEALRLAEMYEGNVKIELNINATNDIVKMNIIEYNI